MLPKSSFQEEVTNNPVFKARDMCIEAGLLASVTTLLDTKLLRIYVDKGIPDHIKVIKAFCLINNWVIRFESTNLITVKVGK